MSKFERGFADASITNGHARDSLRNRRKLAAQLEKNQRALASRMYKSHFDPGWIAEWKIHVATHPESYFTEKFLLPLLRLLILYLRTSDDSLLYVYLDERLRFAPHREDWHRRAQFHSHLVSCDFKEITELCTDDFFRGNDLQKLWFDIHAPLLNPITGVNQVTVLGVGDCLLNEVRVFLPARARREGLALDMRCAYFNASVTGGLNRAEICDLINNSKVDLISFSFFSYEGLPKYVNLMRSCDRLQQNEIDQSINDLIHVVRTFLTDLRANTQIPFLLHTVSGLPLRRWRKHVLLLSPLSSRQRYVRRRLNSNLHDLASALENCLIIDEEAVVDQNKGLRKCSRQIASQRRFRGMFHTAYFGNALSNVYLEYAASFARLRKAKVLCIDFDNTLWRGVMADEDVKQWPDRQKLLIELRNAGMLLVALSKNSEENIRWSEMELKPHDFVVRKINWNTKVQSLREAAQVLNLGIDSFVVVDDSVEERALISNEIPELVCLDSENETTWRQLEWLLKFPNTQQTEEAKNRTKLYQEQAERQNAMQSEVDYPKMMASLRLWFRFGIVKTTQINRVSELIARTNQFNTTTIRYSREELMEMIKSSNVHIFAAELGDRFGSLGLTAVVILREKHDGAIRKLIVDSFVMSCRAMGFSLEDQLLVEIKKLSVNIGASQIIGRYIQTDRNSPCSNLFSRGGFNSVSDTEFLWNVASNQRLEEIPWLGRRP